MIIDFHAHCFSPRIVEKAIATLVANSGVRAPFADGTTSGLLAAMDNTGIDACVIANIATNPRQQRAVNDFAISLLAEPRFIPHKGSAHTLESGPDPDLSPPCRFIPFGSVHPDAPDAIEELRRLAGAGVKGIKLHPDYQAFFADEPRLFPIYEEIARLGLVTLFHAGVDTGLCDPVRATPEHLLRALPAFGGAPVVAAHFGGYLLWREVMEHLCGQDIYFDTSYCSRKIPPPWARRIVELHGKDRVLFGTDLPWSDPQDELNLARQVGGTEDDILGGNAMRLLGLV